MPDFELPTRLAEAVEDGDVGPEWLAGLPRVIEELTERWSLRVGRPFAPGGAASWVAPARDAAGASVVLKVGWPHFEARHEAEGLRAWGGDGAVRLLDAVTIGETDALLLEACEPGSALSQALPASEQDAVASSLLRRLWIEPPTGHPFRSLQSMCDAWADEFEQARAAVGDERLDPGLARAGIELLRTLPETAQRSVLLCTDLHPENILAAQREPWLVIDPKPYVGDPTYDALQYMLNFTERLLGDARGFAQRMADLLELDEDRLQQWLFARCVQESIDQRDLRAVARALAP